MSNADRMKLSLIEESQFGVTPSSVRAQGTLTVDTNPTAGDTMTIGTTTYTFRAALTGAANEILIGGSAAATQVNIVNAIKGDDDTYFVTHSVDLAHSLVFTAAAFVGDDLIISAKLGGTGGNAIDTTETFTAVTNVFDAVVLGTTTAGSGTASMEELRYTSESFMQDTATTQSSEIREDRQVTDVIRTNVQATGDLAFELSFLAQEKLLLAALFASAFSSPVTDVAADTGITAAATGNQLEGGDGDFAGYSAGEWVKVEGFATAGNNGVAKVVAVNSSDPGTTDDDELVLEGIALTDESAGEAVSVTQLGSASNGVVQRSFTFEKVFGDLDNVVHVARGMTVDQFDLNVAIEQIITGSFSLVGKALEAVDYPVGTGYTAAPTKDVMSTAANVLRVSEGGQVSTHGKACATQFSMSLVNNLRARQCIGELGAQSMGAGTIAVTGTLQRYFANDREMDKYLAFARTSLAIILDDAEGNLYVIDLPAIKYTSGQAVAGGQNTDIIAELEWQAMRDADEGVTIRVAKLAA